MRMIFKTLIHHLDISAAGDGCTRDVIKVAAIAF
jgi:hypothetical protein